MLRPALMTLVAATFAGVLMASTAAEAQKAFPGGGGGFRGGSIGGGGFRGGSIGSFRGGSVGSFRGGSVGSFRGGSVGSFRSGRVGSFRGGTVGLRGASIGVGRSGFRSGRVYAGSNVGSWRHGGFRHRFRHGRRLAFIGAPFVGAAYWGGYPYDYGYAGYGDECLQRRLVPTPWGLQWRLVDVCYQYGY